ncbi:MAG: DUF362 domain-containing protein, partial [Clostridia bacterium]|nr:DUF362 domain-containing protein [Clostridia bacterium]
GLTGRDFVPVEISGKHFKEVKIASAIYHADCILAVSHFKGHEATGFGGALKNVGMGTGSRAGKQMMHSDVLPKVTGEKCRGCQKCLRWCPAQAIEIVDGKASINPDLCLGCGECTVTCPHEAIKIRWRTTPESLQEKIVEFAWGALKDKKEKCAFINFVTGVTPFCDCTGWSDYPLVGDIGILASRDPVAVDQASYDLVLKESGLPGSRLGDKIGEADKFKAVHNIDGTIQLKYAEEIGLGSREYDLILV